MKNRRRLESGRLAWALIIALVGLGCSASEQDRGGHEPIAPEKALQIDGVAYETGNWNPDLQAGEAGFSRGNHRAVVVFESENSGDVSAVRARIPWRRHDPQPDATGIVVVDASTNEVVRNAFVAEITNEAGEIVFQPNPGSAEYHVYYLPYETSGGYYPRLSHAPPMDTADQDWIESLGPGVQSDLDRMPSAVIRSIESVNDFHSFVPMEVIATPREVSELLSTDPRPYYLFPEDRSRSIRMRRFLPKIWVDRGLVDAFSGSAQQGEYYAFQIGVYAAGGDLENVTVTFSDLRKEDGSSINRNAITCFNTGGVDQFGREFLKNVSVDQGQIQPLWIGVQVPEDASPGAYIGSITVSPDRTPAQTIDVTLTVESTQAENRGDNEPSLMSRLRWLNSTIGTDPDFVIDPFVPVSVNDRLLSVLGRDIELGDNGLPARILSRYAPEMTSFSNTAEDIISRPIDLTVRLGAGVETFTSEPFSVSQTARGRADWTVRRESEHVTMIVGGAIEYEGMLDYSIQLIANNDIDISDISLPVAFEPDAAVYMLGLGYTGQKRPDVIDWKWEVEKHQEGLWLGGINKGLQYVLRDNNYVRPLNTNFYQTQPLNMPISWENGGLGGIRLTSMPDEVVAVNYSGPRQMAAGDTLHFNVRFLVTPFKPLDTRAHFNTRFVHKYVPVDSVIALGGTVVNIHHANEINPYINYPFFNLDLQSRYIEEAHRKNVKVKLYNTIRELTYRSHELFALRSLGDEILNDGEGGGHSWLQEHLIDGYHSAWHAYRVDDAAILNKGTSRWTNYYVEGLNWLAEHQHIDGLYLDDIAFSRETVKRMISVLSRHRNDVVIDLHSANQFNPRDGFINSAMLYMEHFPFISRLWFGEYFDYDADPDYWITEVSGLPFGLMGEMLQDCGRPYRGMLYGMTTRLYGECDPRSVWELISDFGIEDSRMLGYWLESSPVQTHHPKILATTYVREGGVLVTLASWSTTDETIRLDLDWDKLELDPSAVVSTAPAVAGLQSGQNIDISEPITIPGNSGLFVLVSDQD